MEQIQEDVQKPPGKEAIMRSMAFPPASARMFDGSRERRPQEKGELMIFTSNFKIAGRLPQAVAISLGVPRGWQGRRYKALAPPRDG